MRKKAPLILICLLMIVGMGVMIYPFAANFINQYIQTETVAEYDSMIAQMDKETLDKEREAAREYNEGLIDNVVLTDPFDTDAAKNTAAEYQKRLNLYNDGIMGYIEIPEIDVKLVIYHGTSDEVLAKGVGHLENTSLPVGGTATHAVLSAHTAYPTAVFFDNLTKLEEGSLFILTILDEKLAYEVDQIKVVEPTDTSALMIDKNEDYVTLVTCTPYGVNTHRLLIRGRRVPYVEEMEEVTAENTDYRLIIIMIVLLVIVMITVIVVRKRRKCAGKKVTRK